MPQRDENPRHTLTRSELRSGKPDRHVFPGQMRNPITVLLDGVRRHYNIGAIFRLCDCFLVERLIICGLQPDLRNRKLVQAARGTEKWVPWETTDNASEVIAAARTAGTWVVVAEQTTASIRIEEVETRSPTMLVLGSEAEGVSQAALDLADQVVALPMLGMANSLNISTAAGILIHALGADSLR